MDASTWMTLGCVCVFFNRPSIQTRGQNKDRGREAGKEKHACVSVCVRVCVQDGIQVMQRMYEDAECFIDVCEIPSLSTRPVRMTHTHTHAPPPQTQTHTHTRTHLLPSRFCRYSFLRNGEQVSTHTHTHSQHEHDAHTRTHTHA